MDNFSLAVLNVKGRDPEQAYPNGAGSPQDPGHAPVNFHAYAACVRGTFHQDIHKVIALGNPVLLLIRKNMKGTLAALRSLKSAGLTVAVSMKETGFHQIAHQLDKPANLSLLSTIVNESDGVLSPVQAMVPIYNALLDSNKPVQFIPTPYPVDNDAWDFSIPINERSGIFIGTRDLESITRNHLSSLILMSKLAKEIKCPLRMISKNKRKTLQYFSALGLSDESLEILPPMPYPEYLGEIARQRILFQLDQSMVPGQVAGDCTLCRVPCVGGNGTIETLVYPEMCSHNQNSKDLVELARRLLTDDTFYMKTIETAEAAAQEKLSFENGSAALKHFFTSLT